MAKKLSGATIQYLQILHVHGVGSAHAKAFKSRFRQTLGRRAAAAELLYEHKDEILAFFKKPQRKKRKARRASNEVRFGPTSLDSPVWGRWRNPPRTREHRQLYKRILASLKGPKPKKKLAKKTGPKIDSIHAAGDTLQADMNREIQLKTAKRALNLR